MFDHWWALALETGFGAEWVRVLVVLMVVVPVFRSVPLTMGSALDKTMVSVHSFDSIIHMALWCERQ